jgi:pilus assembly protein FimV
VRIPTVLSWRLAYPALVVALTAGWVSAPAWALTLGRLSAQSSIGQPLVAELEVTQISAEQASSLVVSLAEVDRFAAANMVLNPVLNGLRAKFIPSENRGPASIRLETSLPVTDPFLDIALHFKWSGGELLRAYTVLLDPPNLEPTSRPAALPPDISASGTLPSTADSPTRVTATDPAPVEPQATAPAVASPPAANPSPRVTVRGGDTAARIAQNHLQPGVTMDQLLVALLRNNPNAFINGNVNLVKAGASLVIPTAEQAEEQTAAQARVEVRAQTREFIAYRQRLAQSAPATPTEQPAQRIEGRVEDKVEVITPPAESQDRLELSKSQGSPNTRSEQIAQTRQAQDDQQRVNELERNLEDLQALADAAKQAETSGSQDFDPALPLVDEKEELLTRPNALTESPPEKQEKTAADRARDAVEQVIQHPATLPSALALIAVLATLGVMRARRLSQSQTFKKTADRAAAHASKVPPTVAPDSTSRTSLLNTVPAEEPVDPLAEAEVYMAYGMDDQAESMLRHALAQDPNSLLARLRLLDIYNQRGDVLAFNTLAQDVYDLTLGQTPDWDSVASIGRTLDPSNPLYHPIVAPEAHASLDLPDEVKGLSLDLGSPNDGNPRQP